MLQNSAVFEVILYKTYLMYCKPNTIKFFFKLRHEMYLRDKKRA